MKTIIIILSILAFLVILILILLAWHAFFSKPKITEKVLGPYSYAYKEFTGPYSKTMPVFDEVYKSLKNAGITNTKGIGIYFDDPAIVPAEKLKSFCGSIINEEDSSRILIQN